MVNARQNLDLTSFASSAEAGTEWRISDAPVDYLDVASPTSGMGSKMGLDATTKWPGETGRDWGRPIRMRDDVKKRVDEIWRELGIPE